MANDLLAIGDKIRLADRFGHEDFIIEEFRQCLGVFMSLAAREAGAFTPICELYGKGPDSEHLYVSNYGDYWSNQVPSWMNLPRD